MPGGPKVAKTSTDLLNQKTHGRRESERLADYCPLRRRTIFLALRFGTRVNRGSVQRSAQFQALP